MTDRIEESRDIGVHYPVYLRAGNPDSQGVQRIMLTSLGPEPVAVRQSIPIRLTARGEARRFYVAFRSVISAD